MRVISGRFRGRQLVSFKADHIRPTTDRVKESVFNKIRPRLEGARVLDLFSGTGNLAIEALSQGAGEVTAVELHRRSVEIIYKNLEKLGIENEIRVVTGDVLKYLRQYSGPGFDLIFADPPFTEKMSHEVLEALAQSAVVNQDSLIMIESSTHEKVEDRYGSLTRVDVREYGDKFVSYFQRSDEAKDETDGDSSLSR